MNQFCQATIKKVICKMTYIAFKLVEYRRKEVGAKNAHVRIIKMLATVDL